MSNDKSSTRRSRITALGRRVGVRLANCVRGGRAPGMGASGPPGSKFGRGRGASTRRGAGAGFGRGVSTTSAGPAAGAGAAPRYQGRGRLALGTSGDCSGELSSSERSWPQGQMLPSGCRVPQRLRARIGAWQSKHTHMQRSGVSPHCRPRPPGSGMTSLWGRRCGHMRTFAVLGPQKRDVCARPS